MNTPNPHTATNPKHATGIDSNKPTNESTEWVETTLGEICSRIGDGLHGTPVYKKDGTVYFINGNNLLNGKIVIKEETRRVSEEEAEKHKKPISDRTLLLSINGTIGNIAYYNGENCMLGKSACYLNVSPESSKKYIYYYLSSPVTKNYLNEIATGTTILNVPLKGLREIPLLLPPLWEQEAIAEVLNSLDDKIDLLHRQNTTLEALAQTLFRQWFIEEAKEEWEEVELGELITVKGGTTPSTSNNEFWDGNIYWTSPRDATRLEGLYLTSTERKITEKGLKKISSGLLPKGTLLMTSRAPVGILAFADVPIAINQGYIAILDDKGIDKHFIYLWLKSNIDYVQSYANGSTFLEISKSAFKSLKINLPSLTEIDEFVEKTKPIFDKIKHSEYEIKKITSLRDTLLPKLVSGEVRVGG